LGYLPRNIFLAIQSNPGFECMAACSLCKIFWQHKAICWRSANTLDSRYHKLRRSILYDRWLVFNLIPAEWLHRRPPHHQRRRPLYRQLHPTHCAVPWRL